MKHEPPACPRGCKGALVLDGSGISKDGHYVQWKCPGCRGAWHQFEVSPDLLYVYRDPSIVTEPMNYEV